MALLPLTAILCIYVVLTTSTSSDDIRACRIFDALSQSCNATGLRKGESTNRIVVIGDLHGSLLGLRDILYSSNITKKDNCMWRQETENVTLIQVGDIVDRGPQALEVWLCLELLQTSATNGNEVIRLVGNHDIWWMEGYFDHRNTTADTYDKIKTLVDSMKISILNGRVSASHVHMIGSDALFFVHAGVRKEYLAFLKRTVGISDPAAISLFLNKLLLSKVTKCGLKNYKCQFNDEAFEAGKERGGSHIGGPLWTDFGVLSAEAKDRIGAAQQRLDESHSLQALQIVGHTMAHCYDPYNLGVYPGSGEHECINLIRGTPDLSAICVDAGIYAGARAYLEIRLGETSSKIGGRFIAHERKAETRIEAGEPLPRWHERDLMAGVCI